MKHLLALIILTFALNSAKSQIDYIIVVEAQDTISWDSILEYRADSVLALAYDSINSALQTVFDDQKIDSFSLVGNVISISLEDDGEAPKTIDLTPILSGGDNFSNANLTFTSDRDWETESIF